LKGNDGNWIRYDVEGAFENIYEDLAIEVMNHLFEGEQFWRINSK
jgi:hypothetical protein